MTTRIATTIACIAIAVTATGVAGATTTWNFNPAGKNGRVGASSQTFYGSATGLNPLDLSAPLVTVSGFNADDTARLLYWRKTRTLNGIGLKGARNNELSLSKTGTAFANYIRIDMTEVLALAGSPTLEILMQGVLGKKPKNQEQFDVWGSDDPTSFGAKLLSGCTANNTFVALPLDSGHYNSYYFITVTPQGKDHKNDTVLPGAIRCDLAIQPGTPPPHLPEPATLSVLVLGGVAALLRRRR